jgi:transcription antitermination factor NusG
VAAAPCGRILEPRWCVYTTHPNAERLAATQLARVGYRAYLPLIAVRRQDPVIRSLYRKHLVPMFPGYGFLKLDPWENWVQARYTFGVRDLIIGSNGRPAQVPQGVIESLLEGDAARCDLHAATMPCLPLGAPVRVTEGALQDQTGTVLACDGVTTTCNIELFGRLVAVRLERAAVVAV